MKPTDILKSEHRVIEQMLSCLERVVEEGRRQRRLEAEPAYALLDFFRTFADGCHHGKEEAHLFPAMEAKGFPHPGGPTSVMRHDHEEGRTHVRLMGEAVAKAAAGDPRELEQFAREARAYVVMLREHIRREDHCLFAMADQAFSEADQQALLARFQHVEAKDIGEGVHERFLELADQLAERYGVPKAVSAEHVKSGACGCHHG